MICDMAQAKRKFKDSFDNFNLFVEKYSGGKGKIIYLFIYLLTKYRKRDRARAGLPEEFLLDLFNVTLNRKAITQKYSDVEKVTYILDKKFG